jgi:hypothetical protein
MKHHLPVLMIFLLPDAVVNVTVAWPLIRVPVALRRHIGARRSPWPACASAPREAAVCTEGGGALGAAGRAGDDGRR